MKSYIKEHEKWLKYQILILSTSANRIDQDIDIKDLESIIYQHNESIGYLQHERLVHLFIMLFTGIMSLTFLFLSFYLNHFLLHILLLLSFILLIPYIYHYYYLENTLQGWYNKTIELEEYLSTLKKNHSLE